MGDNLNPLDELKRLDQQVELVTDLADLRPIFTRLDEVAKENHDDFEVQLVVGDIKQHLVNRGTKLKEMQQTVRTPQGPIPVAPGPPAVTPPSATAPPIPPPMPPSPAPTVRISPPASEPTVRIPAPDATVILPKAAAPIPDPEKTVILPPAPTPPVAAQPPVQAAPPKPPVPPAPVPPTPAGPPKAAPPPVVIPPAVVIPAAVASPPAAAPPKTAPPATPPSPVQAKPPVAPIPPAPIVQPPKPAVAPPAPKPKLPAPTQPPAQTKPKSAKSALWIGGLIGALAAVAIIVVLVNMARKRNPPAPPVETAAAAVAVTINTTPPGAKVRINNEEKCAASPCTLQLPPASYSVTAFLGGYDPATNGVTVAAGQPATVNLTLEPQAQSLRILTDLDAGKVVVDDKPPADLQEGQFVIDKLEPGTHTVKVTGKSGEATFTFEVAPARAPQVTGAVTAKNLNAVLVSSFGNSGRVVTNSAAVKLAVDGQPQGDASSAGTDLATFPPGVHELVLGEGKDQRNVKENFGPAPMLTAFLKSDLNIGMLIVSTGEDDVTVFVNNKEYRRKTQKGQVRISQAIGPVNVRVAKNGFETVPPQTAELKKGAEVRLEFKLKPQQVVGALQIRGGTPGAEVLIDLKSVGTIGPDGNFNYNTVQPGDHAIELRRDQFTPKRYARNFKAGQAMVLTGADVVLAAAASAPTNGTVKVARTPADATVTYRRQDESQNHDLRGPQIDLPPGAYVFTSHAPGYTDRTERVQLGAGENRSLDLVLSKVAPVVVQTGGMADFEDPGAWKQEDNVYVHRGEAFLPFKLPPKGVFQFTVQLIKGGGVFRAGRIRWRLNYLDARNYAQFELDKKNFSARDNVKGKNTERAKTQHDLKDAKSYTVQIEVTPDHIVHKLRTAEGWVILDSWAQPGRDFTQGKFGFWIQGSDELGITDFSFTPK